MEYKHIELIEREAYELSKVFSGLQLIKENENIYVQGLLCFSATLYGTYLINDCYNIRIQFPHDYPENPPTTMECEGRIPKSFGHVFPNDTLCLGSPLEVRMKFDGRLMNYVQKLIVPYLYFYSFYEKFGVMPYGELPHNEEGIAESYKGLFCVSNIKSVIGLLNIMASGKYRGHLDCPCGSNKKLRNCHGDQLRYLMEYQSKEQFLSDLIQCMKVIRKEG